MDPVYRCIRLAAQPGTMPLMQKFMPMTAEGWSFSGGLENLLTASAAFFGWAAPLVCCFALRACLLIGDASIIGEPICPLLSDACYAEVILDETLLNPQPRLFCAAGNDRPPSSCSKTQKEASHSLDLAGFTEVYAELPRTRRNINSMSQLDPPSGLLLRREEMSQQSRLCHYALL